MIARAAQTAGADDQVGLSGPQPFQKGGEDIHTVGQIGVGTQDKLAPGGQHSGANGAALSAVRGVALQPDMGIAAAAYQLRCAVGASVVHDEHLIFLRQSGQPGGGGPDGVRNDRPLIVGGNHQRYVHLCLLLWWFFA